MATTKDDILTQKTDPDAPHDHYHAPYMQGCLKCRNQARWKAYNDNPFPIFGKSGKFAPQKASVPGRD